MISVVSFISPYRKDRDAARALHAKAGLSFLEVHVHVPLEVAEARDPKGLYAKARAGEIKGFTGIDDPYEEPTAPDVRLDTSSADVATAAAIVLRAASSEGMLQPTAPAAK